MRLKLPRRFRLGSEDRTYAPVATDTSSNAAAPPPPSSWYDRLSACLEGVGQHRARAHERKIDEAICVCEAAHEKIDAQRAVAQDKFSAYSAEALAAHKAKDRPGCVRALRRKKRLETAVRGLDDYAFDLEQKIAMLNELRTNRDVLEVVKNVGRAMGDVDVDASLREAEDATETIDASADALRDLAVHLHDAQRDVNADDDDALLLELEALVGGGDEPPPPAAMPTILLPAPPTHVPLLAPPTTSVVAV